jgi:hypothetical protein
MFSSPEELSVLILRSRAAGRVSPELAQVVVLIAQWVHSKYRFTISLEDFCQAAVLQVCVQLFKMATDDRCFSYLVALVRSVGALQYRTEVHEKKRRLRLWVKMMKGRPTMCEPALYY